MLRRRSGFSPSMHGSVFPPSGPLLCNLSIMPLSIAGAAVALLLVGAALVHIRRQHSKSLSQNLSGSSETSSAMHENPLWQGDGIEERAAAAPPPPSGGPSSFVKNAFDACLGGKVGVNEPLSVAPGGTVGFDQELQCECPNTQAAPITAPSRVQLLTLPPPLLPCSQ